LSLSISTVIFCLEIVDEGWFYLGPAATSSSRHSGKGVVVQEIVPHTLVDLAGWEQVWNDIGSGNSTAFALWRGIAPGPDYVSLCSFLTRSHIPPSPEQTKGIKAIHKKALDTAFGDPEIWTDKGTGARLDGAVWEVSGQGSLTLIETGAFVAVGAHNTRPEVFVLDAAMIDELN
jgi:hypothetical protein